MKHIINAFKNLPRRGQHNFVKILCLALGLAISSVIIAEIYFEQTYDTYFPGWERTYQISEVGSMPSFNGSKPFSFNQTSGAIAPGVKDYAPMVEAATRFVDMDKEQCKLENQNSMEANVLMADSCFFDIFPQKILMGKAKETLSRPLYCMIDSKLAEQMGGNVVGKHFTIPEYPDKTFTIGGIFESFPWGASLHNRQILVSLCSIGDLWGYDGRNQWVGNDNYFSYIRLAKGHEISELRPYITKMKKDHFTAVATQTPGFTLDYEFTILSKVFTQNSYIKMMGWILGIIAFVLLFTSVMNYLLIIVGNLVTRSREMAVRKCYGAEPKNIHAIIFSEALVHVGLAVILAAVLVFLCKGTIENFLSAPVSTLVFNRGSWILVSICLLVLLVGGLVPGWLYNKIPVAIAFRGYNENRNRWKLALLGVQFVISGLLFSLLFVVNQQYSLMVNMNPGYNYENVAIVHVDAINGDQRSRCLSEIKRMPDVKEVASAYSLPLESYAVSGNNVQLPDDRKSIQLIHDAGGVDDNYFRMMGIDFVQGSFFTERNDSSRQVIIDEALAKRLTTLGHWKDGAVGKRIWISAHCNQDETMTICGVVKNIKYGTVTSEGAEFKNISYVYFYAPWTASYMLVKFNNLTEDALTELRNKVQSMYPNNAVTVLDYESEFKTQYASQLNFRNGILVAGIVTMIIALFGLVGYTSDEVNRRRKEIAIRKVNGAKVKDILRIFLKDIIKIALPCIFVGDLGAWLIARQWLMSFSEKITMTPLLFIGVTIILLVIIGLSVVINCYKVANSNPVKYLKDE
ncbi:ABC transporter permease [Segatella hominis]|uniref:ABC transporter permease n=1 Tax=Segatella hominis TaxID=2518605 RepID=A0A4Y8VAY9_9BACT|nr:ABC transporter permease [Segatella hominis]TFH78345.1 ABC transporter permease [Segatella hominis]